MDDGLFGDFGEHGVTMLQAPSLTLQRHELAQLGSNAVNTTRLLRSLDRGKVQSIVHGSHEGRVSCFHMERARVSSVVDEFQVDLGGDSAVDITALTVDDEGDLVVVATEQRVRALKRKKGRVAWHLDSQQNEDIRNVEVRGDRVWTGGSFAVNCYAGQPPSEVMFFMADDRINHMAVTNVLGSGGLNTVLGCQDRYVRVLDGDSVAMETGVEGPVTAILPYTGPVQGASAPHSDMLVGANEKHIIYGTENGVLGQAIFSPGTVRKGFSVAGGEFIGSGSSGGVSCLGLCDMTQDGTPDLIVGREDGNIEVYAFDNLQYPQLTFSQELGESVTSVDAGHVITTKTPDVLVSTYSGKLRAFSYEAAEMSSFQSASLDGAEVAKQRISQLQDELASLRVKLDQRRQQYSKVSSQGVAVAEQFKVKSRMLLRREEACHHLSVEIEMPLDTVVLHSTVPLMLLDVESMPAIVREAVPASELETKASSSRRSSGRAGAAAPMRRRLAALPSDSASKPEEGEFITTFQCVDKTNRLTIKLRAQEGSFGTISVVVIPRLEPKTSKTVTFQLQPLLLHEKVHGDAIASELAERPLHLMTISGDFSLPVVQSWLARLLPSVNPRVTQDEPRLFFRSAFTGTVLSCVSRDGSVEVKGDDLSTLGILRDTLTSLATKSNVNISSVNVSIQPDAVRSQLETLAPQLEHHFKLHRHKELLEPLRQIQAHAEDTSVLFDEYREILEAGEDIEAELAESPKHLAMLKKAVVDLYESTFRLRGRKVPRAPDVNEVLSGERFSLQALVELFKL